MNITPQQRIILHIGGYGLGIISMLCTAALMYQYAPEILPKGGGWFAASAGVFLEIIKFALVPLAFTLFFVDRKKLAAVSVGAVALPLVFVSIAASYIYLSQGASDLAAESRQSSDQYQRLVERSESIDDQIQEQRLLIQSFDARLHGTGPITQGQNRLDELRDERSELGSKLENIDVSGGFSTDNPTVKASLITAPLMIDVVPVACFIILGLAGSATRSSDSEPAMGQQIQKAIEQSSQQDLSQGRSVSLVAGIESMEPGTEKARLLVSQLGVKPSVRVLSREHGFTQSVARESLNELEDKGVIYSVGRNRFLNDDYVNDGNDGKEVS